MIYKDLELNNVRLNVNNKKRGSNNKKRGTFTFPRTKHKGLNLKVDFLVKFFMNITEYLLTKFRITCFYHLDKIYLIKIKDDRTEFQYQKHRENFHFLPQNPTRQVKVYITTNRERGGR